MRTLFLGSIPVLVMSVLMNFEQFPGTDIDLTVPYAAQGPGPIFDTLGEYGGKPVIDIEGAELDETSGELQMTTVSVRSNMTLPQAVARWLINRDTLVPIEEIFPPGQSEAEVEQANQEAFFTSEASATIAAMTYLDLPVSTRVAATIDDTPAGEVLKEGDLIRSIDDHAEATPAQVREVVLAKNPGDQITVTIERDGEQRHETITLIDNPHRKGTAFLGVSMEPVPGGGISVDYTLEDVGGPSAGMIFSLAVIDKLSPGELTGGKIVAGTGTVDDAGAVGPIGGITHKIRAAKDADAEVFLTPAANCVEAKPAAEGITLIKVTSVADAIEQLQAYNDGEQPATCG